MAKGYIDADGHIMEKADELISYLEEPWRSAEPVIVSAPSTGWRRWTDTTGPTLGLVLELVEGPTLAEKLQAGRLPVDRSARGGATDRRRARSRAPAGDRAPRSEARQHQGARRRHRQGARLRTREGRGAPVPSRTREPSAPADSPTMTTPAMTAAWNHPGHRGLHVSRTGERHSLPTSAATCGPSGACCTRC